MITATSFDLSWVASGKKRSGVLERTRFMRVAGFRESRETAEFREKNSGIPRNSFLRLYYTGDSIYMQIPGGFCRSR